MCCFYLPEVKSKHNCKRAGLLGQFKRSNVIQSPVLVFIARRQKWTAEQKAALLAEVEAKAVVLPW